MKHEIERHGAAQHFGEITGADSELAYRDVLSAWRFYLAHENAGRGVVLIGHSQGAYLLMRLLAAQVDGKKDQGRLVSAILLPAAIVALLVYEHSLVKPHDFSKVNAAFFTVNGYVSVLFFLFWAADIYFHGPRIV